MGRREKKRGQKREYIGSQMVSSFQRVASRHLPDLHPVATHGVSDKQFAPEPVTLKKDRLLITYQNNILDCRLTSGSSILALAVALNYNSDV